MGLIKCQSQTPAQCAKRKLLTWLRLGAQLFRALEYLHCSSGKPVVHRDVKTLNVLIDAEGQASDAAAPSYAELLFDVAAISSGYELNDPAAFTKRVIAIMSDGDAGLAALATEPPAAEEAAPQAAAEEEEEVAEEDKPIEPEVM